jgi:hypothetical protein
MQNKSELCHPQLLLSIERTIIVLYRQLLIELPGHLVDTAGLQIPLCDIDGLDADQKTAHVDCMKHNLPGGGVHACNMQL